MYSVELNPGEVSEFEVMALSAILGACFRSTSSLRNFFWYLFKTKVMPPEACLFEKLPPGFMVFDFSPLLQIVASARGIALFIIVVANRVLEHYRCFEDPFDAIQCRFAASTQFGLFSIGEAQRLD